MEDKFTYLSYGETGRFSRLVDDYTEGKADASFFAFGPGEDGIAQAIAARESFPVNRSRLVDALSRQYEGLEKTEKVADNIRLLGLENTLTVTTAHQPNLATGYLYFIYKILHAIKLAQELSHRHAGKNFVPVYYMGSEDADLDELGTFRFRGERYQWDGAGQHGAVGRMDTASLKPLLNGLFRLFGPPGPVCDELREMFQRAYLGHQTVGAATRYLVNALFGRFGLLVLDPDDAALKAAFVPVMQDELLNGVAHGLISNQTARLNEHYQAQMFPRPINLFYLSDQLRERIERQGEKWLVLNTDIAFTREELLAELHRHPERFSPNVALRPLFQETILPDVAFIGGGAEVAYWLQLLPVFRQYGVFYPPVLLRQSVLWIPGSQARLMAVAGVGIPSAFLPLQDLLKSYVLEKSSNALSVQVEMEQMEKVMERLAVRATEVDVTLAAAAAAATEKMRRQVVALQKKMLRAEKRKMNVQVERISKLWNALHPNGSLQERTENFLEYYLEYGPAFFDVVLAGIRPLEAKFLVVEGQEKR